MASSNAAEMLQDNSQLGIRGVLALVAFAFLLGVGISALTDYNSVGLVMSLVLPTLVAFFGVYWVSGVMRDAIAAGFFVAYFTFLFTVTTLDVELESDLADTLISSFTSLTAVVFASFFGARAIDAISAGIAARPVTPPAAPVSVNVGSGAPPADG